jgi:hypothetical protein
MTATQQSDRTPAPAIIPEVEHVHQSKAPANRRGKHEPLAKLWTPDASNGRHTPAPASMAAPAESPGTGR